MTTKQRYLTKCMSQPVAWLQSCAANPSPYMTRMHVALVRLAVRKLLANA